MMCRIYRVYFYFVLVDLIIAKTPNVLFVIVDDLKPALGCYGDKNAYTPNIDKLCDNSFVFTNAYTQQALCAPSRNSLLTSRRPDSLHLYDFYNYWRKTVGNYTTLPQHFKENGYYTHSIGKVFHPGISSNYTDDSKYSWSDEPFHPQTEKYTNAKVCIGNDDELHQNLFCPVIVNTQPLGILPDLESLNAAVDFLKDQKNITTGKPFFLAVGFHKPHVPFKFPIEYLRYHPIDNITLPMNRFRPSLLPTVAWNPWIDIRRREDIANLNISFPFGPMPDDAIKKVIQHYSAATTYVDDLIGDLLKHVDNNTIIVLTGDHGWSRGEHGEFSKYSNFDEVTRVPLIVSVPKMNKKKLVVEDLVELVDLFPTLVDLTQVSEELKICLRNKSNSVLCTEGSSLLPLMVSYIAHKEFPGKTAAFSQYPRPGTFPTKLPNSDEPHLKDIKIMGYSMRTNQYRYTEWVQFNNTSFKPDWTTVYGRELYDHTIDNGENLNLANRDVMENVVKMLRKKLILGWRYA